MHTVQAAEASVGVYAFGCLVKASQKELDMQNAVHNCATMRVADRAGLSVRVTADEVNLDRFHSCIHKLCALVAARSKVYLSVATMILIVTLAVPAVAQITFDGAIQGHERGIPNGTGMQSTFGTVTGIVSNLGQLSLTYDDTINLMTGIGTGSGVLLIAKNGDSIFTTISGTFTPPSGSTLTVPSVKETYIICGGTGRFKRATGKFTVERLVAFGDAEMDFAFTGGVIVGGTITFPNAENAQ
jgi:hypothetical protein